MTKATWEKRFCKICNRKTTHRIENGEANCWACVSTVHQRKNKQTSPEEENPELLWKKEIRNTLDSVGLTRPSNQFSDVYDDLVRAHKRIFGDDHDLMWTGVMRSGVGLSRAQLDTSLLIRIHNMLKHLVTNGMKIEKTHNDDLDKNNLNFEDDNQDEEEWDAIEDFQEIELSEFPKEFKLPSDKKYITRGLVNSEGIYRIEVENEPVNYKNLNAVHSYWMDYNPKAKKKFKMH